MPGRRRLIVWFVGLVLAGYLVFRGCALLYVHLEWFRELHMPIIFWRTLTGRLETGAVAAVLFGGFVFGNLRIAAPSLASSGGGSGPYAEVLRVGRRTGWTWLAAAGVGLIAGWVLSAQWATVWLFKDAVPFGVRDPIYHRDVADYVFRLPFYEMAYETAGVAFWIAGLGSLTLYFATGWFNFFDGRFVAHPRARAHLFGLLSAYLALKAVGYRLDLWNLLFTQHGIVPGVSYVDAHVHIPIL